MIMENKLRPLMAPFRASEIKIERAKRHLQELEALIAAHVAANPPPYFEYGESTRVPAPPKGSGQSAYVKIDVTFKAPIMPEETGAILGDVIHNLRSSLDVMATDVVRCSGGNTNNVYFPFSEKYDNIDLMIRRRNFHRASPEAIKLLKEFRPYRGGDAALRALHDLDVEDKHRLLLPVFQGATGGKTTVVETDGILTIVPSEAKMETLLITFPADVLGGSQVIQTLHELVELTARIVEAFKTLAL